MGVWPPRRGNYAERRSSTVARALKGQGVMAALPRLPAPATSTSGSGTYPVARVGRVSVVVLDRDAQVRATVAAALDGCRVHEAEALASAAAMIGELRPRVVLCSIAFDALELVCFARWLRATFGKTVALVMLTQPGNVAQAIRAVQLGARGCVELPVNGSRLRATVAKHSA